MNSLLSCLANQKRYCRIIFMWVDDNKLSKLLILICRGTKHLEEETPDKKEEAMVATSLLSLRQEIDEMKMREDKLDELIEYCQNEMKTLNNENSENCSVSKELNRYLFKVIKTCSGGRLISNKYEGHYWSRMLVWSFISYNVPSRLLQYTQNHFSFTKN